MAIIRDLDVLWVSVCHWLMALSTYCTETCLGDRQRYSALRSIGAVQTAVVHYAVGVTLWESIQ